MNKCCPKCGTETSAGQKFCAKCGQALESGAYDDAVESGEPVVFSQNASSNSEKSIKEKVSDLLKSTNKRIIFAAAAVLIIGLILFFAFHTFTPSNNRIKADLTDYIDDVRTGTFSIKKLAVDDKEFYDNKQYLDIICAVTLESDCVRRYESYELSYMKRESGGWKVVDISECDYNYWSSEPISGVTEQYIIDIYTQSSDHNGHYNHIDTINRVRRSGSIPAFIEDEHISDGIMYSCVKDNVPFVLCGSIRDDGPLPEVYANVYEGQEAMRACIRKATTVITMATALHSIATGNMTPSFRVMPDGSVREVYFYCVDVAEFAVNKLADRGSLAAKGIVTNAQDFVVNIAKGLGLSID